MWAKPDIALDLPEQQVQRFDLLLFVSVVFEYVLINVCIKICSCVFECMHICVYACCMYGYPEYFWQ